MLDPDIATHVDWRWMCEEVRNAATVVPTTIIPSIVLNFLLGNISMLIAVPFCIGDIYAVINAKYNCPFIGSPAGNEFYSMNYSAHINHRCRYPVYMLLASLLVRSCSGIGA